MLAAKTQIVLPPPLSQQVIYRQTARLRCIATTDVDEKDHLKVKWLKNGKLINLNNKRIKMEADNTLVITNAQVTDSAQYTCNATNELDYALANANITVKGNVVDMYENLVLYIFSMPFLTRSCN